LFNNRSVPAFTNSENALTHKTNSCWLSVLLVVLLGWLCFPADAQAATRDRKKPTVPTDLTATPVGCNEVSLSWTASTDTGGSGLMAYRIYRNGVLFKQVSAPATKTSDVGLSGTTRYSYAILAVDKAGNKSAKSLEVFATTPACCNYSIVPLAAYVAADGGSGSITVTTGTWVAYGQSRGID
jgi:chitodextrinase